MLLLLINALSLLAAATPLHQHRDRAVDANQPFTCPVPSSLTSSNATALTDDARLNIIRCTAIGSNKAKLISSPDCLEAMKDFPTDSAVGKFHRGGAQDAWRLPAYETYGGCVVGVDFYDGVAEGGDEDSWASILRKMCDVTVTCSLDRPFAKTTGGWTTAGRQSGLKITIQRLGPPGEEGQLGGQVQQLSRL